MNAILPKISVIVPVYNVENYVSKCLDSIIGQTYKNLEIIVVNDGSTDNSGNICEDYAKRDERICFDVHHGSVGYTSCIRQFTHRENDGLILDYEKKVERQAEKIQLSFLTEVKPHFVV